MSAITITGFAQGSTDPVLNEALGAYTTWVEDPSELHRVRHNARYMAAVKALAEARGWDPIDTHEAVVTWARSAGWAV